MKQHLLPHSMKRIGWFLLVPALIAGSYYMFLGHENLAEIQLTVFGLFGDGLNFGKEGVTNWRWSSIELIPNVSGVLLLIGGLLVVFSKEKKEDEFISQLRLSSLQFAVLINYLLLLICFFLIHGFSFLDVMVYNMFTVIFLYIIRFQYLLHNYSIKGNDQ